jgi:hypothetical protein
MLTYRSKLFLAWAALTVLAALLGLVRLDLRQVLFSPISAAVLVGLWALSAWAMSPRRCQSCGAAYRHAPYLLEDEDGDTLKVCRFCLQEYRGRRSRRATRDID